MGKSIDPIGPAVGMRDAKRRGSASRLIVSMSFQLAIPWRVALPQSPPPFHRLTPVSGPAAAASSPVVALEAPRPVKFSTLRPLQRRETVLV